MNKGTVIFYKRFHFSNGELGEKLLINCIKGSQDITNYQLSLLS